MKKVKTQQFNQEKVKILDSIDEFDVSLNLDKSYFKYSNTNKVLKGVSSEYRNLIQKMLSFCSNKYKFTSLDFFIKSVKRNECTSNTVWHWDGRKYNFQDPDRYVLFHSTIESMTQFIETSLLFEYDEAIEKGLFIKQSFNPYLKEHESKYNIYNLKPFSFAEYNSLNIHRAVKAKDVCHRLFIRLCESNHIEPR